MTRDEMIEFRQLVFDVKDLRNRILWHNEERKELMKEKKELLKRINAVEKKYDGSTEKKGKREKVR